VRLKGCRGPKLAVYTGDRVNRLTRVADHGFCYVQFSAQPGVTYHVVADDQGHWGKFRMTAIAVTPPPNDDFADATAITLGSTVSATTLYASREPGEPPTLYRPGRPHTVWFRLIVDATTGIQVDASRISEYSCSLLDGIQVYTGEQLNELQEVSQRFISAVGACGAFQFDAPPGVYSLRAEASVFGEGDFQLTARAVP
jgi:hypothetical protein